MKETVRYGFILGVICLLASGILAFVNAVTEPQIEIQKRKNEDMALKEVLPDASEFRPKVEDGKTVYYTGYDSGGKPVGFALKAEGKGYSSTIEVITGVTSKLEITGIKVLSQNETPGLGSRITENKFLNQFKGKGYGLDGVEAITGATISSSVVISAVKEKLSLLKKELSGGPR